MTDQFMHIPYIGSFRPALPTAPGIPIRCHPLAAPNTHRPHNTKHSTTHRPRNPKLAWHLEQESTIVEGGRGRKSEKYRDPQGTTTQPATNTTFRLASSISTLVDDPSRHGNSSHGNLWSQTDKSRSIPDGPGSAVAFLREQPAGSGEQHGRVAGLRRRAGSGEAPTVPRRLDTA